MERYTVLAMHLLDLPMIFPAQAGFVPELIETCSGCQPRSRDMLQ